MTLKAVLLCLLAVDMPVTSSFAEGGLSDTIVVFLTGVGVKHGRYELPAAATIDDVLAVAGGFKSAGASPPGFISYYFSENGKRVSVRLRIITDRQTGAIHVEDEIWKNAPLKPGAVMYLPEGFALY